VGEAVASGDPGRAMALVDDLLAAGAYPLTILTLLVRQTRHLLQARLLWEEVGMPGFRDVRGFQARVASGWEAGRFGGVQFGFHDENGAGGPDGEIAAREGNAFTNHGVSWAAFQPTPDSTSGSMDPACSFADDKELFQVGFHFAWDQQLLDDLADWVLAIDDPTALRAVLRQRAELIFERCPGLDRLDVLNEPLRFLFGNALYANHFFQVLGPDYIAELFQIVRAAAPEGVELFINENFVEYYPARAAAFVALVRDLVENGVPVDAVGLQMHLLLGEPDWTLYRETMEQLEALGVAVFVSELDVPVPPDLPDRFEVQAERYRRVVEVCLAVPGCDMIIVWGIGDEHSWLNWFDILSGPDPDPLLFDDFLQPKPAYFAVREALLRGRGGDHPISGTELVLTRHVRNRTVVSLSSDDPGVVTPSPGSRNDPGSGDPGGATVELLRPEGAVRTISVPAGKGWLVAPGASTFWSGFSPRGPAVRLQMWEGRGLRLELRDRDLAPSDALDGMRIRITMGSLRICVDFGPETVALISPTRLVARAAPKSAGYDCSY
jgi:GH35 family endo-1,4-beta-xylanase